MRRHPKRLIVTVLAIAATAIAADEVFRAQPAASYSNKQVVEKVTIAAAAFDTEEKAKTAFGKVNPNKYGVLPVLVVIHNGTGKALNLSGIRTEYVGPNNSRMEATPVADVPFIQGPSRPKYDAGGPIPGGGPRVSRKKNPLKAEQIEMRSFQAKMLPPGEEASGFFYFQAGFQSGSQVYVTGLKEAGSVKEIFYVEVPLSD